MALRILMTTTPMGGVWTYGKELAIELLRRGCRVSMVLFGRAPSASQQQWLGDMCAGHGDRFEWTGSSTPLEGSDDNADAFLGGVDLLQKKAISFRADVLLSNQYCWGALELFRDAARTQRLPKVVVAHSDIFSWAEACHQPPFADTPWLRNYIKLVTDGLRGADAVVAPSKSYLRDVSRFFQLPANSHAIHCWRTLPLHAGRPGAPRKLQAITAGRLWDQAKNMNVLGDADLPLPVWIAGENAHGSKVFEGDVGTARFTGPLGEDELLDLFRDSAIYICTSQYEPFGLAPVEAALCGCAVVCFDIPSLREVWGDGAEFFSNGDELRDVLRALVDDPRKLAELRQRSGARALRYDARGEGSALVEAWVRLLTSVAT